ncbi:farnesyl-diphosphate synthase [Hypnocyclicus thermotrophus]|uniref:Farnesyl-diphosphate synthase n=1 Tax=Hypnocyclicus thermotrophus TaxID=1627895 RepID=A0AA46DXE9_9FUSO|nr:farnesyl diphosphate synthase [Hypnocyclicus thermotrophus]TDT68053.1 farnesyl-diphosphate synthase [Hypnocyclicus thermotrophus]
MSTNLKTKFEYYKNLTNTNLENFFNELNYPQIISSGMKYSVLNGGKRLRPFLLLATLEMLNIDIKKGIPSACAIELIHSYSLVHDDLPALDNDDLRRGKLTTHKKYGEANGILIGDALLTHAFYLLSEKNLNILSADKIVKIISLTSKYAGINGMIGGQTIDIESENKQIDLPTLQYIHTHKTGKMILLPIEIAIIIANLDDVKSNVLKEYAEIIGLTFQIKDDILDIEGEIDKIGKPIGSDLELNKSTYPSIFGLEKTKEILQEKTKEAKELLLNTFGETSKILIELADFIANRDN